MGQSPAMDGKRVAEFDLRWSNRLDTLHRECRLSGTQVQLLSFCDGTGQVQSRSWWCRPLLRSGPWVVTRLGKRRRNVNRVENGNTCRGSSHIGVNEAILKDCVKGGAMNPSTVSRRLAS